VGVEYADPKLLDTMHEFGITLEGYKGDLEHAVERGDEESGLVFEPGSRKTWPKSGLPRQG